MVDDDNVIRVNCKLGELGISNGFSWDGCRHSRASSARVKRVSQRANVLLLIGVLGGSYQTVPGFADLSW